MIEIRIARPEEVQRQKELWKLAFGDEDAYIDYFYAHLDLCEMLVLLEDGEIYTMVGLYPVTVALPGGGTASSAYIYALATHPDARKKGFGRFILSYVDFYLKEKGLDCVTIVPAEPSLHKFFGATGFSECFSTRKVELLRNMIGAVEPGDELEPCGALEYGRIREQLLAGSLHVSYGSGLIDYQRGLGDLAGGGLYKLTVSGVTGVTAVECLDSDTVLCKELVIPTKQMAGAAALVARKFPAVRYHLRTPPFWDGLSGSYLQAFGMVKWYDQALAKQWRDAKRGYMGLGFD